MNQGITKNLTGWRKKNNRLAIGKQGITSTEESFMSVVMNKIIIPSIFAGILIVAAAFAVMPIEKASTVHTTIQASVKDQVWLTDISLVQNTRTIIFDNAGQAGSALVEVTARLGTNCEIQTIAKGGSAWTAPTTAPFPVTVTGETSVPVHFDQNVEAVSLFASGGVCNIDHANGHYMSVTVVKGE